MRSEVRIEAMVARASRRWRTAHRRLAAIVAGLAITATGVGGIGSALAVEPPPPGPLDRPISDVALIDSHDGPPLLLVADTTGQGRGRVRLALLDRAADWGPVAEIVMAAPEIDRTDANPWLIETAPNRFVLLQNAVSQTVATPLQVQGGGSPGIALGGTTTIPMAVDDAGAIDVDGNGTAELVLANARTERGGETCQGSTVKVLDGTTLEETYEWRVPNIRLAGGVLGDWDDEAGGDLLAYAYGNCPAGPDSSLRLGVHAIRLVDGATITTIAPADRAPILAPGVPLVADLDADGRDEVVVREGATLSILEPGRGWARTQVDTGDVVPILATSATADRSGSLVWLEHYGPDDQLRYTVATVGRVGGEMSIEATSIEMTELTPARRSRVFGSLSDQALAQAPPQAWRGAIEEGCVRTIAPLLTTGCEGFADQPLKVGASWLATRPITTYDDARGRRKLLIAATVEWVPDVGVPRPATPAAVAAAGAWRHGPSAQFVLSEARAADAAYFSNFPVPRPTIDRRPVRTTQTDLPGFTGNRVFARLYAMREQDPAAPNAPNLDTFFRQPASARELISVGRIPVAAGAESGRDGSFIRLPLDEAKSPDGLPPERWTLTIVQINDWGEVAGPLRSTIVLDASGPTLTVETPFIGPVWPFETTIRGRSEPGVEIRGGNGGPVTSDRRGRFEVTAALLPWPQTVELVAVDNLGNSTTARYSFVGGLDYRLLPWPAILAVILLAVTFWSTGRGTRPAPEVEVYLDAEPKPEIEELTPGRPQASRQQPRFRTWRP